MWKDDISLKEELVELASAAGIEDFRCECWSVFETEDVEVFALSCAWTYRNKLYHYTDTLEVF